MGNFNLNPIKPKVFLGGTCNGSQWRKELIPQLKIGYFDPVVENWTPGCQAEEIRQRQECDFVLYVITPKMKGMYSIAEVVDDSNKRPGKTILCVLHEDGLDWFEKSIRNSLDAVAKLVKDNGAAFYTDLVDVAVHLNFDVLNPSPLPSDYPELTVTERIRLLT